MSLESQSSKGVLTGPVPLQGWADGSWESELRPLHLLVSSPGPLHQLSPLGPALVDVSFQVGCPWGGHSSWDTASHPVNFHEVAGQTCYEFTSHCL